MIVALFISHRLHTRLVPSSDQVHTKSNVYWTWYGLDQKIVWSKLETSMAKGIDSNTLSCIEKTLAWKSILLVLAIQVYGDYQFQALRDQPPNLLILNRTT